MQVLPQFFNQSYARNFGYQILIALSTNFIGYGLAGLTRRFIVYPTYCVWPASLVTIALNSALHNDANPTVPGPFKKLFSMSRNRFFMWSFGAMFVYFWFPNYLFEALTYFSWMTWIAPDNLNLNILTGFQNGLGVSHSLSGLLCAGLANTRCRCSTRSPLLTGTSCFTTASTP